MHRMGVITIHFEDSLLSINNFGKPKTVNEHAFIYTMLVRLVLLEPGTIQSHPDMGIGITSKYRYMPMDEAISSLKTELQRQISMYLPELSGVEIDISQQGQNGLSLKFNINGVLYDFNYDTNTGSLQSLLSM